MIPRRQASALAISLAVTSILPFSPGGDARAGPLAWPVRTASTRLDGPVLAAERVVLRLRPEAARRARLEWDRGPAAIAPARAPSLEALGRRMGAARLEPEFPGEPIGGDPDLSTFWIAHLAPGTALEQALASAGASAEVAVASPVTVVPVEPMGGGEAGTGDPWGVTAGELLAPAPNDSMWSRCYWLYQASRRDLHALEAWDVTRGDSTSVIAVLDTGVLRYHPDLGGRVAGDPGRIWTNRAEEQGVPGVDDDGNGYVDDTWGWDYVALDSASLARPGEDWRDEDNDPNDFAVHGTAVAGVAAAIANNGSGTAGVAPGARIMALRVGYSAPLNPPGEIDLSWAARAILYAVRNGATVINCSFTSTEQPDLDAAVTTATRAGVVVVVAAGNRGPGTYLGERDDVLSVTATDQLDKITLFSTLGSWVDCAAPGQSIATTTLRATGTDSIGLRTPYYSPGEAGTSFSSPMGAAAVAMLQTSRIHRGLAPLTPEFARLRVMETADDISSVNTVGGYGAGRINLQRLLTEPERSIGFGAGAATVGAPVILPVESGGVWLAWPTADRQLLVFDPARGDTVTLAPLGGTPTGGLAAIDRGTHEVALFVGLREGRVAGFDLAGRPLPGWPVTTAPTRGALEYSPALADLDGDGAFEVTWGGADGNVWAWKSNGARVAGFPRRAGIAGDNVRVCVADLDGLPGAEIVVAPNVDSVYAFRGDGSLLPGWPIKVDQPPAPPLVTRLGALRRPAVVVGVGNRLLAYSPAGAVIFQRNLYPLYFYDFGLADGDLDGDVFPEIVAVSSGENSVAVLDSTGAPRAQAPIGSRATGAALIGPLTPGSGAQVLVPAIDPNGTFREVAFSGSLALLHGWPKSGNSGSSPSLGQLDADDGTEIAAGSGGGGTLYVFDAGAGSWRLGTSAWPTAGGNFARTGSRLTAGALPLVDDVPPAAVADLRVVGGGASSLALAWTATGNDGSIGRPARYRFRWAESPIGDADFEASTQGADVAATVDAGGPEHARLAGLPTGREVWVRVRAIDAMGNASAISNEVRAKVTRLGGVAGAALAPARSPATPPVAIEWQGDAAWSAGPQTLTLFDVGGRVVRRFVLPAAPSGTLVWDGVADSGARARAGLYFARLESGGRVARGRVVLLR